MQAQMINVGKETGRLNRVKAWQAAKCEEGEG